MDKLYDQMHKAIEQAIQHMMSWEIVLKKEIDGEDLIVIRQGVLDNVPLWFIALQTSKNKIPTESEAEDKWGEKVLASIVSGEDGLVLWVYDDIDEMMTEMTVMFNLFVAKGIEE